MTCLQMGFSDSVIIFHPGSRHLYLGRATDPHPCKILQLIARRRYDSLPDSMTPSTPHHDSLFPKSVSMSSHEPLPPEVETAKLQLSLLFQSSSFHAASSKTASNPPSVPRGDTNVDPNLSFHIGDQVIHLTSSNSWNIHCPWRRGALNLHRGIGGSLTSVLQDLEDIWLWSLKNLLHINPATLKDFRAILVIPVMFDRSHTNHLANLLLNRLGFQACILVQDHVCASFGAGLSCCTVVDVGDQKLSVSCVEDAISYPQSRLTLNYGGGDLTFSLARILLDNNHIQIPPSISSFDLVHWEFLTWLKESRCHLHLSASSSTSLQKETLLWNEKEYNIQWPKPPPDIRNIIPLAYFNPDLLGASVPKKGGVMYWVQQPAIPDDPHNPVQQDLKPSPSKKRAKNKEPEQDAEPILAIDKAILQSIEKCSK